MPDYKEMYITLFNSVEKAIDVLIEAQQRCEEIYVSQAGEEDEIPKRNRILEIKKDTLS